MSRCPTCNEVQKFTEYSVFRFTESGYLWYPVKSFERDNEASEYHFTCPEGHEWTEDV